MNIVSEVRFINVSEAVAAGKDVAVVQSGAIALNSNSKGCLQVKLNTVVNGAVIALKFYESDTANGDFTEIPSFSKAITFGAEDSNKVILVETIGFNKSYVKTGYQRTTQNIAIDSIMLLLHGGSVSPQNQDSTVKAAYVIQRG